MYKHVNITGGKTMKFVDILSVNDKSRTVPALASFDPCLTLTPPPPPVSVSKVCANSFFE